MSEHPSTSRFREFLRIKTVQPSPDYKQCTSFLERQAKEMNLPCKVIECVPGKPVVVISWIGIDSTLPSVLLNCHTDVVPVFVEFWKYPPFDAVKDSSGDIFARGAQDMKCVGISYLEAIRNLINRNVQPKRSFHMVFVPDEEIGGKDGMLAFTRNPYFKSLNVGYALDEGLANPGNAFKVYYGERAPLWVKIRAEGNVGHGSQFIKNTAASKLQKIISKLMKFRDAEEFRLENICSPEMKPLTLGDVTTVNWTMSNGGVQMNVVPQNLEAGFDIRVSPSLGLEKFKNLLKAWCDECNCTLEFVQDTDSNPLTPISDENMLVKALKKASNEMNIELQYEIFPASTDGRYLRQCGIPTLGVSPIRKTPVLLHDHNEYLNEKVYLDGISWYERVISYLGD